MIRIREISAGSAENRALIRRLHDEIFGEEADMPNFDKGWWWLAEEDWWYSKNNEQHHTWNPVAFAWLSPSQTYPEYAYLGRSGVIPKYRGQGIQKRLITIRERKARKQGYLGCVSDTTSNLYSANNLIACGYRMHDPKIRYGFKDTLYWKKVFRG